MNENRQAQLPRIDFHIHLAGDGSAGSGCLITARMRRRPITSYLCWVTGLPRSLLGREGDRFYRKTVLQLLETNRELELGLLLAYDRIYRDDGSPDDKAMELYVPNDYVLELARRSPRVLAGVSIHPYRADALDELERCAAAGAAALKWIPVSQNIDPADRRCRPFYDRLAVLGLPLICHTGPEHVFRVIRPELKNPAMLRPALERGATVVAAHCGLNVLPWESSYVDVFAALIAEYPNLYGDVSALALPRRPGLVRPLLSDPLIQSRLIHGSDWPIPIYGSWLRGLLPLGTALRLDRTVRNALERDVAIKRALGLPEEIFHRAATLVPPAVLAAKRSALARAAAGS